MTIGQKVWVAEVGTGARAASVVRVYEQAEYDRWGSPILAGRVVVSFHDNQSSPERDCYVTSVFETREAAEKYLAE